MSDLTNIEQLGCSRKINSLADTIFQSDVSVKIICFKPFLTDSPDKSNPGLVCWITKIQPARRGRLWSVATPLALI